MKKAQIIILDDVKGIGKQLRVKSNNFYREPVEFKIGNLLDLKETSVHHDGDLVSCYRFYVPVGNGEVPVYFCGPKLQLLFYRGARLRCLATATTEVFWDNTVRSFVVLEPIDIQRSTVQELLIIDQEGIIPAEIVVKRVELFYPLRGDIVVVNPQKRLKQRKSASNVAYLVPRKR